MLYEETLREEASQVDSYSEQTREQREFQGAKAQQLRMAWSRVSTEEEEGTWGWPGVPSGKAQSHYSYVACYSFSSRSQQWAHAFKQPTVLSTAPEIHCPYSLPHYLWIQRDQIQSRRNDAGDEGPAAEISSCPWELRSEF